MILDPSLLYAQYCKLRINGKWSNPVKEVASFPTPQCSSYWKQSLRVAFNYGRPIYALINKKNNIASVKWLFKGEKYILYDYDILMPSF